MATVDNMYMDVYPDVREVAYIHNSPQCPEPVCHPMPDEEGFKRNYPEVRSVSYIQKEISEENIKKLSKILSKLRTIKYVGLNCQNYVKPAWVEVFASVPQLVRVAFIDNSPHNANLDTRIVKNVDLDKVRQRWYQSRQWQSVTVLTAFLRANSNHEYKYSILPLIPGILNLARDEP